MSKPAPQNKKIHATNPIICVTKNRECVRKAAACQEENDLKMYHKNYIKQN